MKNVIISADGPLRVYSVPDAVADNLYETCLSFCDDWLRNSPHAAKYRCNGIVCYNEADFIGWLNEWVFPEAASVLVEDLGFINPARLPEQYQACPRFNF